jgi:diguanylate cyclase (GGDEF)-like protein
MADEMHGPIRVLCVEDLEVDAERALYQLRRAGLDCLWRRVETEAEMVAALAEFDPTIILSDFSLPRFDGMSALRTAARLAPNVPFLFLSGTIGEERAIEALHAGAVDYVLKENLARLAPAVLRAIREAATRVEQQRQQAQIARLNRVLRMLSGVNGLVLRIRDRTELLQETCRLATSVGGYAAAVAAVRAAPDGVLQCVASGGADEPLLEKLRACVTESAGREGGVIGNVLRSGREFVCNNTAQLGAEHCDELMVHGGLLSVVALPLLVDSTAIAVLVLTARDSDVLGEEELHMLREVAGNLSFGLQYLQRDTRARFLSHFDPQTGLAKRPLFCERVQRMLSAAEDADRIAIVVMDIERLSVINDSFGRRIGDLLLQHVADRLRRHCPDTEHIAHFGGGTFALLRPQGSCSDDEVRTAGLRRAEKVFGEPFLIEEHVIPVVVRTGFAMLPDSRAEATELVQNAEAALRYARSSGEKNVLYNAQVRLQSIDQLALEHRLRFALERNEFELHYQPKVHLMTRRVQGAEALLRWRSPQEGLVPAGAFLPLLEATGLIVQVGDWVVEQAARDCLQWNRAGVPPVRIAVNIAPAQLRHPDFEEHFQKAARSLAGTGWSIDIEITEGVLQDDSPEEIRKLKALRAAGTCIAIDDFGTGYSSLSRLAALPIDTLKIDRSFVRQSLSSASGSSLVRTIIALARTFDMTTVAEGVERQEELDLLWQLGCDQAQGYLHSPALTPAAFGALLREGEGLMIPRKSPAPDVYLFRSG